MTRRFRMVAGPNGSGKTTLAARLASDYSVNFYTMLNADDVFAVVRQSNAWFPPFPVTGDALAAYASHTSYAESEKRRFTSGEITVDDDCVRFHTPESVNSYTVALLVNFMQDEFINRGISFSQETVFSHPSKVAALAKAHAAGFRTYLYFISTDDPEINVGRVANRHVQGGHDVPDAKIRSRYARSLENAAAALPYLSRAFFFDNSGTEMKYLASYSKETGFELGAGGTDVSPRWFTRLLATKTSAS